MEAYLKNNKCEKCGAINKIVTTFEFGETVCSNCGWVLEDRIIDETYEKRNFGSDEGGNGAVSRLSGPIKLSDMNANFSYISESGSGGFRNRNQGRIPKTPLARNKEQIKNLLEKKGENEMMINSTITVYDTIFQKDESMKGRNFQSMIGAMYYIACKKCHDAKTFKEISQKLGLDERKIKKSYNYIKKIIIDDDPQAIEMAIKEYISNFCLEFNLKEDFRNLALELSTNIVTSLLLDGKKPITIVALTLYLTSFLIPSSKSMFTDKDIVDHYTTMPTIINGYKKVKDHLNKIIPKPYNEQLDKIKINI